MKKDRGMNRKRIRKNSKEKRGILCALMLIGVLALTGCGKKEVSYNEEKDQTEQSDKKQDEEQGNAAAGSLREALGAEDRWTERIESDAGMNVNVAADVIIPDVSDMYTSQVSEYYYTSADKQKVAEYFLDKDSIKVDVDNMLTKENLTADIDDWDKNLKIFTELEKESDFFDGSQIPVVENEKNRLEALLADAPAAADVSEDVGDYSQDYYKGSKDGADYTLKFCADKENNMSSWQLKAKEYKDFNESGYENYETTKSISENNCTMSEDEARDKAEKICEELELPNMQTAYTNVIKWVKSDDDLQSLGKGEREYNGYEIILTRSINGAISDAKEYLNETPYLDTQQKNRPYQIERVIVRLNDKGIIDMEYQGIMNEGETGEAVKLLGFDQIKEALRQEMTKNGDQDITYASLTLEYLRISNEENGEEYSYIPAWRLRMSDDMLDMTMYNIWVNAIDGTVIDYDKQCSVRYFYPEEIIMTAE